MKITATPFKTTTVLLAVLSFFSFPSKALEYFDICDEREQIIQGTWNHGLQANGEEGVNPNPGFTCTHLFRDESVAFDLGNRESNNHLRDHSLEFTLTAADVDLIGLKYKWTIEKLDWRGVDAPLFLEDGNGNPIISHPTTVTDALTTSIDIGLIGKSDGSRFLTAEAVEGREETIDYINIGQYQYIKITLEVEDEACSRGAFTGRSELYLKVGFNEVQGEYSVRRLTPEETILLRRRLIALQEAERLRTLLEGTNANRIQSLLDGVRPLERNRMLPNRSPRSNRPSSRGTQNENRNKLGATTPQATSIYPLPAQDNLTVEGATGSVRVLNTTGQIVLQEAVTSTQHNLDVSTLKSGIYFLKTDNMTQPKRVMVQ